MAPYDVDPRERSRLVFIVTSHATAAGFLPGIAAHLARSGWDVTVVCSPPGGVGAELVAIPGVRVVTVPMARDPSPAADLHAGIALWRVLRGLDPDVVLTATPKAGLLGTVVARLRRVPLVVHLMWGLRSETLTGARRVAVRALEGVATRFSHAVVPNSPSLAAELVRLGLARAERVTVLGGGSSHGVDTSRFRPRPERLPKSGELATRLATLGDGPVIGFVGRITADKGIETLLDAVELLRRRGRTPRLFLVGSPEDEMLVRRIRRARDSGAPVLLLDEVVDLRPHYAVMDVHCLPTMREGFPNVCLEAAACGVPTVTTDATGAVDAVRHGRTGLVVARGNVPALAAALEMLLDDEEMQRRMGQEAREWAVREFDHVKVCHAHAEYLSGLLRQRADRRGYITSLGEGLAR